MTEKKETALPRDVYGTLAQAEYDPEADTVITTREAEVATAEPAAVE